MQQIIFITGPTATGKTEVSYLLAQQLNGQIVSCDSMLIYKEPKVITSKPGNHILKEIPHHFVDVISVKDSYNVFDYYQDATKKIKQLYQKGINVIVCGGSGLYLKAILDGIFEGASRDDSLRKTLEEKLKKLGKDSLFQELKTIDPDTAKKLSANDTKRVIRALEVYYSTGVPLSSKKKQAQGLWQKLPLKIFGLRMKRALLYERINERVERMFSSGAIQEVKALSSLDLSITAKKMIGLGEIEQFFKGQISIEQAKENMKKNTRNFAKRQLTWFRADKRIEWIDIDKLAPLEIKEVIIKKLSL